MSIEVGFYGKLPTHGDFLRRRVPDQFVVVWDAWLQGCFADSRAALGERWLDVYLTSPVWRFACASGVCGPQPVAGVMAPSVDRVGRYFYLTVLAALPEHLGPLEVATSGEVFFERAEELVLETLALERIAFDDFDSRVAALHGGLEAASAVPAIVLEPASAEALADAAEAPRRVPLATAASLGTAFHQLVAARLSALYGPLTLWWTNGSDRVEPGCLIAKGLPSGHEFTALLDGTWEAAGWLSVPARVSGEPEDDALSDAEPPRLRAVGATDIGRVRTVNQDSHLERTEIGLWVVADGVGGHGHGEVASRMVCDALADFTPEPSFEQTIGAVNERVQGVNSYLDTEAERSGNGSRSGSTIVTLLIRGTRFAALWAGDSRLYVLRQGRLERLTEDHGSGEVDAAGRPSTEITRAVGGESTLTLDSRRGRVSSGDRFLLCSDGLTRIVSDDRIAGCLREGEIQQSAEALIASALEAGAPDNVTVLVVEAFS